MKTILILVFSLLFFSSLLAQNDYCETATEIQQVEDFQIQFTMADAHFDLLNGDCVEPNESPNKWFKFEAIGTHIKIDIYSYSNYITLGKFTDGDCINGKWVTEICSEKFLRFSNLEIGEEYYIIINKVKTSTIDEVSLGVKNFPELLPDNDFMCDAISLTPDSTCITGTTVNATRDFYHRNICDVTGNIDQSVWYKVDISEFQNKLEINIEGLSSGYLSAVRIYEECKSARSVAVFPSICEPPYSIKMSVLEGETYYFEVASDMESEGEFTICAIESGPPPGCSESDHCEASAQNAIPTPVANGQPECINDCNIGAFPDIGISNCITPSWPTTFYEITTDRSTNRLSITVNDESGNMDAIGLVLLQNCNTFIECNQGVDGYASLKNVSVRPNKTYKIGVAVPEGSESDNFNVCVQGYQILEEICIERSADTSMARIRVLSTSKGSELSGPFSPGEEVEFEFVIDNYALTTTQQWLQAIIPVFGSGWSPSSFSTSGQPYNVVLPMNENSESVWDWFVENSIYYNGVTDKYSTYTDQLGRLAICYYTDPECSNTGIVKDQGLPGGWYAYRPGGANCENDGNPNHGYGDGSTGPWVVRFSLTVRDFEGPGGCEESGLVDCSVKMFTMSDEQTGCWQGAIDPNACAGDEYKAFVTTNKCCISPIVTTENKIICNRMYTGLQLTSDMDDEGVEVEYTWEVQVPASVSGAVKGYGEVINQVLTNYSNSIKEVKYLVTSGVKGAYCPGVKTEVIVSVLPTLVVDAGDDIAGCIGETFILGSSSTASGGSGEGYTYEWDNGLGNIANPEIVVDSTTKFSVTVTDIQGCEEVDEIVVQVSENFSSEIQGDLFYCSSENSTILTAEILEGSGSYNFLWEGPVTSSERTIEATAGVYTLTIDDGIFCSKVFEEIKVVELPIPIADYSYETNGLTCDFEASSYEHADYLWMFGDGETSTSQNPQHTYDSDGEKQVTLIISNNCGSDTITQNITFEATKLIESSIKFNIFPNPFNNEITIDGIDRHIIDLIELFTIDGRSIDLGNKILKIGDSYRLNTSQLNDGAYYIRIHCEGNIYYSKVIKL